jgi:hypothetical protein
MLRLITAITLCAGASAASAASIESFQPTASTRSSIVEVGCPICTLEAEKRAAAEATIKLAPGEQIIEVRELGGEKMIYRTEGWLGGSPVVMVSKASEADLIALGMFETGSEQAAVPDAVNHGEGAPVTEKAVTEPALVAPPLFEPVIANTAPGVDTDTTTSALGEKPPKPFDASQFQLRLN